MKSYSSIRRAPRKPPGYERIPRVTLQDSRLSFAALGLLCYLLSLPDGWRVLMPVVQREWRIGRCKMRRVLHELIDVGYVVRSRTRDERGRWFWEYLVNDETTIGRLSTDGGVTDGGTTDGQPVDIDNQQIHIININTTTTTTSPENAARGGGLIYPRQLTEKEVDLAAQRLGDLSQVIAQELLDELAASLNAGTVRKSPLSYLRSLVDRAMAGTFSPEAGVRIAASRERQRNLEIQRLQEHAAESQQRSTIPDEHIEKLYAALGRKQGGSD